VDELRESAGAALYIALALVVASYVLSLARRRLTIYHVCLPVAFAVLLVVLADVGAANNHLLDVQVLATLVVGALARFSHATALALAAATAAIVALLYVDNVAPDARATVSGSGRSYPVNPLGAYVSPRDQLLSQDPSIPVSLGRSPVVLDPFMLLRLDRTHPQWGAALVRRIERDSFDKVVLTGHPDPDSLWWRDHHFGPRVASAIFRHYGLSRFVNGYSIYVPR
jgi:hypothetical protein